MDCVTNWSFKAKNKTDAPVCVWDICFSPDGKTIVATVANHLQIYRAECGTLMKTLKGHKDITRCVDYSNDGSYFASAGADKCVIIWKTANYEGTLKYTHNGNIQSVCFNPKVLLLASCASGDLGFWSPEQKAIKRLKLSTRPICMSWNSDGNLIALGLQSGVVSIRKQDGGEVLSVERGKCVTISNLHWSYLSSCKMEVLGIADWSECLSFYQLIGKQISQPGGPSTSKLTLMQKSVKGPVGTKCGKDRFLNFVPLCLNWVGDASEYVAIGGQNKKVNLYSYEGCQVGALTEETSWVLSCKQHPKEKQLVLGCQDGTIRSVQYSASVVHSLYRDRYAFREIITDVVIQHLVTEQKARIKCRDVVRKIAIFRNRLAIQLSDRVLIYDSAVDDSLDMHYRIRDKVMRKFDCQLLVVTAQNLVYCQDCRLTCINMQGLVEREWLIDAPARYIRQIGGPFGNESLIVGMLNGQVTKITLNSNFPVPLIKVNGKVKCLDLSANRDKLAVIDDSNTLTVHSLQTKEILLREPNAVSVAWNQVNNDLVCYCSMDTLYVMASDYECHQQNIEGVVVGFSGSVVYCLSSQSVRRVDVQLAPAMYYYLDSGRLQEAHQLACLGVTDTDWRHLGNAALTNMQLDIARTAFIHLGDYFYLTYVQQLKERQLRCGVKNTESSLQLSDKLLIEAELACFKGDYNEAVKTLKKGSYMDYVVNLYTDLRRFAEAKEALVAASGDGVFYQTPESTRSLLAKHAEWARKTNDHRAAASMFIEVGDFASATELAVQHGWVDILFEISRKLDKGDRINLDICAKHLARLGEYAFAAECYARIGDVPSQLDILVKAGKWDESLSLVHNNPEYTRKVYLPYAQWLAENDSFEEAQAAFARAGLANEASRFLEELTSCAIFESRFNDASWYYWKLSRQCAEAARLTTDISEKQKYLKKFEIFSRRADIYYVYDNIHRYMNDPFANHMPEAYFNMARYLFQRLGKEDVEGVSKAYILFTLAKHSKTVGAFKLARFAYEKLGNFHTKPQIRRNIENQSLAIRTTPYEDSEDVIVICFRCSATNPTVQTEGCCTNCKAPFIFSFVSFEILPLVEFVPDPELSSSEAYEFIKSDPVKCYDSPDDNCKSNDVKSHGNSFTVERDMFAEKLVSANVYSENYQPVVLDADTLKSVSSTEVIIMEADYPLRTRYFKNVLPDVEVTYCKGCKRLFQKEDYEVLFLQKNQCPFCRVGPSD